MYAPLETAIALSLKCMVDVDGSEPDRDERYLALGKKLVRLWILLERTRAEVERLDRDIAGHMGI